MGTEHVFSWWPWHPISISSIEVPDSVVQIIYGFTECQLVLTVVGRRVIERLAVIVESVSPDAVHVYCY